MTKKEKKYKEKIVNIILRDDIHSKGIVDGIVWKLKSKIYKKEIAEDAQEQLKFNAMFAKPDKHLEKQRKESVTVLA